MEKDKSEKGWGAESPTGTLRKSRPSSGGGGASTSRSPGGRAPSESTMRKSMSVTSSKVQPASPVATHTVIEAFDSTPVTAPWSGEGQSVHAVHLEPIPKTGETQNSNALPVCLWSSRGGAFPLAGRRLPH